MGAAICAVVAVLVVGGVVLLARRGAGGPPGTRRLAARYRDRCTRCSLAVVPGELIDWHPETKRVEHVDCRAHAEAAHAELVATALAKLEKAAGPASRRNALSAALAGLPEGQHRQALLLEASRIEVTATLDKVDSLKSAAAKRRHLEAALKTLRDDEVPDELQREQLAWLEDALRALEE